MMYIKNTIFHVVFSSYAERHFCKSFAKKYPGKGWRETRKSIEEQLKRTYNLKDTSLVDMLWYDSENSRGIFKLDFRVAGTKESPKSSGNRVIFALSNTEEQIEILIVYAKTDITSRSTETAWIALQIKENFPEYKKMCK